MFLLFSVGMSISIGTTALVARFTGGGEADEATVAANQSVWIAGIASVLCVALMLPLRGRGGRIRCTSALRQPSFASST